MDTVYGPYAVLTQREGALLPETETLLRAAVGRSGADCLYADAAIVLRDGSLRPVYKPVFSPDTLLSYNYVGSPLFLSKTLWNRIRSAADRSLPFADLQYSLTVRALLFAQRVEHIPHILFCGAEPPVPRQTDAVRWGMSALGRQGAVGQGLLAGSFAVRYSEKPNGMLSVIVRTNDDVNALRRTMEAFELRSTCLNCEFLIAAGDLMSEQELRYCELLKKYHAAKLCYRKGETNDAAVKNFAASQAGGEYLLFLEAGVEPDGADAAERMMVHAGQRRIAAVGGILRSDKGEWQQSELLVDAEDRPIPRCGESDPAYAAGACTVVPNTCIRNVTLLGSGAFLLRTDVFLESGGFDETFDCCYCEAALSLSLAQRQMYNVCTPYARFIKNGVRRISLSRRNAERCADIFRPLRVHGDPMRSQNAAYTEAKGEKTADSEIRNP